VRSWSTSQDLWFLLSSSGVMQGNNPIPKILDGERIRHFPQHLLHPPGKAWRLLNLCSRWKVGYSHSTSSRRTWSKPYIPYLLGYGIFAESWHLCLFRNLAWRMRVGRCEIIQKCNGVLFVSVRLFALFFMFWPRRKLRTVITLPCLDI
jgi:hypothetical protein